MERFQQQGGLGVLLRFLHTPASSCAVASLATLVKQGTSDSIARGAGDRDGLAHWRFACVYHAATYRSMVGQLFPYCFAEMVRTLQQQQQPRSPSSSGVAEVVVGMATDCMRTLVNVTVQGTSILPATRFDAPMALTHSG